MSFDAAHITNIFQGAQLCPFLHHLSESLTQSVSPMMVLSSPSLNNSSPLPHTGIPLLFFPPLKTSEELQPLIGGENLALLL